MLSITVTDLVLSCPTSEWDFSSIVLDWGQQQILAFLLN